MELKFSFSCISEVNNGIKFKKFLGPLNIDRVSLDIKIDRNRYSALSSIASTYASRAARDGCTFITSFAGEVQNS